MKKVMLFVAVAAFAATTFTSCKKDYTCECKMGSDTYTYELKDVKKKDAKDACNAAGSIWILGGGTCDLK